MYCHLIHSAITTFWALFEFFSFFNQRNLIKIHIFLNCMFQCEKQEFLITLNSNYNISGENICGNLIWIKAFFISKYFNRRRISDCDIGKKYSHHRRLWWWSCVCHGMFHGRSCRGDRSKGLKENKTSAWNTSYIKYILVLINTVTNSIWLFTPIIHPDLFPVLSTHPFLYGHLFSKTILGIAGQVSFIIRGLICAHVCTCMCVCVCVCADTCTHNICVSVD